MQFSKFYKLSNVVVQFAEISMKLDNKSCNSKKKRKTKDKYNDKNYFSLSSEKCMKLQYLDNIH